MSYISVAQSIQDFLQFGSHINQQTVFYPLQMEFNLATELGKFYNIINTIFIYFTILYKENCLFVCPR